MYVFENNFYLHNFRRLFVVINTSWVPDSYPFLLRELKATLFSRKENDLVYSNEVGCLDNTSNAFVW